MVLMVTTGFSGCRFGNYSESPTSSSQFSSIDLYRTTPTQFKTYAFFTDGTNTSNTSTPLSAIPSSLLQNFTDPLYLVEPKATPGVKMFIGNSQSECFADPLNSGCINTIVNSDLSIGVQLSTPFTQFGSNPSCQMNLEMQQIGELDHSNPSTITYSDGTRVPILGRLLMDYQIIRTFQGDCTEILTTLAACYQSGTNCTTEQLYWANAIFDLYVRQAGIVNISDASRLQALVYILSLR
jgi:hypothetical protein